MSEAGDVALEMGTFTLDALAVSMMGLVNDGTSFCNPFLGSAVRYEESVVTSVSLETEAFTDSAPSILVLMGDAAFGFIGLSVGRNLAVMLASYEEDVALKMLAVLMYAEELTIVEEVVL